MGQVCLIPKSAPADALLAAKTGGKGGAQCKSQPLSLKFKLEELQGGREAQYNRPQPLLSLLKLQPLIHQLSSQTSLYVGKF